MNRILFLLLTLIPFLLHGQLGIDRSNFQDTVYLNQNSGNYVIEYLGNSANGENDTIITMIFEPGTKIEPIVEATVHYQQDSAYYLYKYKITNGNNATQNLVYFSVFFDENIEIKNKQTNDYHGGWYSSQYMDIAWWGDGGLEANWSADGFAFSSEYLPGIGRSGMKSRASMLSYKHGFPSIAIEKKIHQLSVGKPSFVLLPTLIAVKLPTPFISTEFIDSLLDYNHQSYELSWIKNETAHNKYNNYLKNAKNALEQADTNSARTYLQKIITEVDMDSSTSLTSEAYALLKFNTEYLLEQLPEINIEDMFDILINHINECYDKGWIDNKGIMNSLTKKVERAKTDYLKAKIKTTINKLYSFNNELKAQKTKHLNEECYDLLFTYCNYIIEKLH